MKIQPHEIDSVEEVGTLNNNSVKIIKLKGGFHVAIGTPRGKNREEALSGGSHPAIVKFNLEKQYPEFRPAMMKSEAAINNTVVVKHSHYLSEDLKKSGHDIYSVQSGASIEFQVTKHDLKIGDVQTTLEKDVMVINNLNMSKEFASALAGATTEKALSCGASRVKIQGT